MSKFRDNVFFYSHNTSKIVLVVVAAEVGQSHNHIQWKNGCGYWLREKNIEIFFFSRSGYKSNQMQE